MTEWLLVDGYNVIFSWADMSELGSIDLSLARDKLIDILHNYSELSGKRITLVFDAHMVNGSIMKRERRDDLEIVFTSEGETADMFIEKSVGERRDDELIFVVTADWIEQSLVFGRGAFRMTPNELRQEVIRTKFKGSAARSFRSGNEELLEGRLNEKTREVFERWRRDDYKPAASENHKKNKERVHSSETDNQENDMKEWQEPTELLSEKIELDKREFLEQRRRIHKKRKSNNQKSGRQRDKQNR